MELKLKLGEVINLNQTLKSIIDDNDSKVDALFKFKLLGIMKSIEAHVTNFEIIRNEKIMEYGTENEDGNIQIPKEDTEAIEKFNESLLQLVNSEVSVTMERLKACDVFDQGVKAEYLMGLYTIIEE